MPLISFMPADLSDSASTTKGARHRVGTRAKDGMSRRPVDPSRAIAALARLVHWRPLGPIESPRRHMPGPIAKHAFALMSPRGRVLGGGFLNDEVKLMPHKSGDANQDRDAQDELPDLVHSNSNIDATFRPLDAIGLTYVR